VVSVDVESGASVSETVRRLLEASGTGLQLLSFPGEDPVSTRGQAFFGRAAECIIEALSRNGRDGSVVPAEHVTSRTVPLFPSASQVSGSSVTQNNQNVSAPVTINVNASGADANRIGQSIYDTAERYLLRTLRGAYS
jgi:hypothetical protein